MKVKVNGVPYEVVEEPSGDVVYSNPDGESRLGVCDYVAQRITLYEAMSLERKRSVLAHELAHAHLDEFGWTAGGEAFNVEQVCEFVAVFGQDIARTVNELYPLGY